MYQKKFMDLAIKLANENLEKGGGPFGAVIVKDGEVIASKANSVTLDNDPTAHAEVNTIREACRVLNTFDLTGCEIYSSCEPCPMCFSALSWSHIDICYYANTKEDAEYIGFDDAFIYEELKKDPKDRKIPFIKVDNSEAIKTFEKWTEMTNKTEY
jgi:tRNA(Arg) A34 adenosine deaminase TadA